MDDPILALAFRLTDGVWDDAEIAQRVLDVLVPALEYCAKIPLDYPVGGTPWDRAAMHGQNAAQRAREALEKARKIARGE